MKSKFAGLLLLGALAACSDDPTTPALEASVLGLLSEPLALEVGEVRTLTGSEAAKVQFTGSTGGAEYLYVPFFASESGTARLSVNVSGRNTTGGAAAGNQIPTSPDAGFSLDADAAPVRDDAFHHRLREWEHRELGRRVQAARNAAKGGEILANRVSGAQVIPEVGSVIPLNVPNVLDETLNNFCLDPLQRTARIAAVSDRAIVAVDTENPPNNITDAEFADIARDFGELVYPVNIDNFGEPTDLDDNSRIILFYTRVVNELTGAGASSFTAGFFFAGDLFSTSSCPQSNEGEIFYLLAPDPTGAINGNVRTEADIVQSTVGVTGHEFQHLINAARRIYINDADDFEELWLNEGLSHIAEELLFYEVSGLQPRQNIDLAALRSSDRILAAVNSFQVQNLLRYSDYVGNPDEESLLGIDNLPTRGASWAFLRYAADHEPGPDRDFFFSLVNSTLTGVDNLSQVLDSDAIELMQTWTVSVYTDDQVQAVPEIYTQPSWDYRSVLPVLDPNDQFPLPIQRLSGGTEQTFSLLGGGAAFVRFGIDAGTRAVITTTSGGNTPPSGLRVSIVRIR